jgi:hypothetical protein
MRGVAAAFAVTAVLVGAEGGARGASVRAANTPPTIGGVEHNLGSALARAKTERLLRFDRQRTKTPQAPVDQVVWVNLATGRRRMLNYDASGHLMTSTSFSGKSMPRNPWNASAACGCDLDPFTNFPGQAIRSSKLLGEETIGGRPTFHLRFTVSQTIGPSTTDFWIDRSTYLPVRSRVVYRVAARFHNGRLGPPMTTTDRFTWLPRTSANFAHLAGR